MKKITEYEQLTPLEVAEIGEREGWPVEGLVVSHDCENWIEKIIRVVIHGGVYPFNGLRYCARPIEKIEWEIGDTVQTDQGVKGKIQHIAENNWFYISDSNETTPPFCALSKEYKLKPWKPGYGYTEEGELIKPPESYEIVPEGEPLSYTGKLFQHGAWHEYKLDGNERNNFAQLKFDVRAYARKIEPQRKTAEKWFYRSLPTRVAGKAINNTSSDFLLEQYESALGALQSSFVWETTPEGEDYWRKWHIWLNGDTEETPPIEPDPIAEGHNPEGLTVSQIGKGWRLLSRDEIAEREPTEKIQAWLRSRNSWSGLSIYRGSEATMTYRTQQPEGYFLPVADSLEEYYGAKQQPAAITQEMIERAFRPMQDYREIPVDEHTLKGGSLVFHFDKTRSGDQCQKLADALNDQLREKVEEPKSGNLKKLSEKWESELKRHKGKAKVYNKTSPYIANMWRETAGVIEDMLGELNDVLDEDKQKQ